MMGKKTGILKRFVQDFYLVLILVFLYAPIATMTVLSFNSSKSRTQWGGFTTRWYTELFSSNTIMTALYNTLLIAFLSSIIAVIIGTAAEAECDKLCVVTAPFEVSVERIAARDGISPEMAARRLNAQTPEAVLTARADYILPNTSTLEALAKAANELCDALIGEGCCA